ncbi:MAG: TRAP transporter fused permease subunit [Chloroflexi bacterium]|nr:TRAP transporter fused permease subunit [Chloroflexota bacterium]
MDADAAKAAEIEKITQELIESEDGPFRSLRGPMGLLQRVILVAIPVTGILFMTSVHTYFGWMVYTEQYIGLFLTLMLAGAFLSAPATKRSSRSKLPWYDVLLILASLPTGLFLTLKYPEIAMRLGELSPDRTILGALAILLILEAVRRYVGWPLLIVVVVFIAYGRFADLFPSTLHGLPTSWDRLLAYLYLDPNSMLDQIALASGIALAFMFFGQVLQCFGGGDQLTDFAMLGFGRFRGGAAKAAVVGSSLVGTISGGAVTNVLIGGHVTISMMKKTGYNPAMAGAVEAVSSSGGQIMPPVMGIAAFLIAENLGVPYADVALAAFVPAMLFYLACFVQVDLEAGKGGLRGLTKSEIPNAGFVLRNAWTVLPCLGILVYTLMVQHLEPSTAAIVSGFASVPFMLMAKVGRGRFWRRILEVFESTGRMSVNIGVLIAASGIIVGVTGISGLGFNLAYTLTTLGRDNSLLLLVLAAFVSLVLGTGLPTVPAYALVATLVAPALVQLGILPMAAHLFLFYFAIVSNWTPPVAPACFAASVLSGANADRIGWISMRLGILAYIVPFLFVYSPALILKSDSLAVIIASLTTASLGTLALGVALVGYLFQTIAWPRRVLFLIAGSALLLPIGGDINFSVLINAGGLVLAAGLLVYELYQRRTVPVPVSAKA